MNADFWILRMSSIWKAGPLSLKTTHTHARTHAQSILSELYYSRCIYIYIEYEVECSLALGAWRLTLGAWRLALGAC